LPAIAAGRLSTTAGAMSQSDHSASWTAACADPGGGGAGVDAGQLEHAQPIPAR